jgi:outer membrane protein W
MKPCSSARRRIVGLIAVLVIAGPGLAAAQQQGDWHLGGRLIYVDVDARSETVLDTTSRVTVDTAASLELDATYLLGHNWGLEFMITTANHDLGVIAGELDGLDLGSVWIAESTITLRYIIPLYGRWRPYVGAGVGAAYLHNSDPSDPAVDIGIDSIQSDVGFGFVAQLGVMHRLTQSWFLTFDLKWSQLPIDLKLKDGGTTIDTVETDLDPFIIGIGGAYRF